MPPLPPAWLRALEPVVEALAHRGAQLDALERRVARLLADSHLQTELLKRLVRQGHDIGRLHELEAEITQMETKAAQVTAALKDNP